MRFYSQSVNTTWVGQRIEKRDHSDSKDLLLPDQFHKVSEVIRMFSFKRSETILKQTQMSYDWIFFLNEAQAKLWRCNPQIMGEVQTVNLKYFEQEALSIIKGIFMRIINFSNGSLISLI